MASQKAYVQSKRERAYIQPINGVPVDIAFVPQINCDSLSAKSIISNNTGNNPFTRESPIFNGDVNVIDGVIHVTKNAEHIDDDDVLLKLINPKNTNPATYVFMLLGTTKLDYNQMSWIYRGNNDILNAIGFSVAPRPRTTLEIEYRTIYSRSAWVQCPGYKLQQCINQSTPGTLNTWWKLAEIDRSTSNTGPIYMKFFSEGESAGGTTNLGMADMCYLIINCNNNGYVNAPNAQMNISFWKENAGPYNVGQTRDLQVVVYLNATDPRLRIYVRKPTGNPLKATYIANGTDISVTRDTARFFSPGINCGDLAVPNDLTAGTLVFDSDQPSTYPYWTRPVVGRVSGILAPVATNDAIRVAEFTPAVLGSAAGAWSDGAPPASLATDANNLYFGRVGNNASLSSPIIWTGVATGGGTTVTYATALSAPFIPANDVVVPIYITIAGVLTLASLRIASGTGTISITSSVAWVALQIVTIGPLRARWYIT